MKHDSHKGIITVILLIVGTMLAWGGMLYAIDNPEKLRLIGVVVSLLGYVVFLGASCIFE